MKPRAFALAVVSLAASITVLMTHQAHAIPGKGDGAQDTGTGITGRMVETRNASGRIDLITTIVESSMFASHGGRAAPCGTERTTTKDPVTNEDIATAEPSFKWRFVEGQAAEVLAMPTFNSNTTVAVLPPVPSAGRIEDWMREFAVFCEENGVRRFLRSILVPALDPTLDPRQRVTILWNSVQLTRPVVVPDDTVNTFGILVTRHPSWFAIEPPAWGMRTSNIEEWHGQTLQLALRPIALTFAGTQRPPIGKRPWFDPGVHEPFTITVPCVGASGFEPAVGATRFPERPRDLAAFSEPGIGTDIGLGGCVWTPAYLGIVTVTARITYEVTLISSGRTTRLADYTWESLPVEYTVDGLSNVNVTSSD
jgi:hypothetical protein